jgi:hypothetical protein
MLMLVLSCDHLSVQELFKTTVHHCENRKLAADMREKNISEFKPVIFLNLYFIHVFVTDRLMYEPKHCV